jgi:hypothetical protein
MRLFDPMIALVKHRETRKALRVFSTAAFAPLPAFAGAGLVCCRKDRRGRAGEG